MLCNSVTLWFQIIQNTEVFVIQEHQRKEAINSLTF